MFNALQVVLLKQLLLLNEEEFYIFSYIWCQLSIA